MCSQLVDNYQSRHRYSGHNYFEALDFAVGELERRFDQSDFSTIMEIEKLIVDAANGIVPKDIPDSLLKYWEGDIDVERSHD